VSGDGRKSSNSHLLAFMESINIPFLHDFEVQFGQSMWFCAAPEELSGLLDSLVRFADYLADPVVLQLHVINLAWLPSPFSSHP
jgi:hypothetical protein